MKPEEKDRNGREPGSNAGKINGLDGYLLVVVSLMLVSVLVLLIFNLCLQWSNYSRAISFAIENGGGNSAILTYSRAMDFAFTKAIALCLGFLLIFTGMLYLLRVNQAAYTLALNGGPANVSLQTSSPGLVIVTLGVLTVLFTIYSKSYLSFSESPMSDFGRNDVANIQDVIGSIQFEYDSAELTKEGEYAFGDLCGYIQNKNVSAVSIKALGDGDKESEYEMALGERRQNMLLNRLRTKCVHNVSFDSVSYGEKPSPSLDRVPGQNVSIRIKE